MKSRHSIQFLWFWLYIKILYSKLFSPVYIFLRHPLCTVNLNNKINNRWKYSWIRSYRQSYVIKSAPWTILWFRILGIFSAEYIKRLCVFMFETCSNSQLLRRVLWISAEQTIGASFKHKNTQPLYMFNRVRVLHLNRLKERTWLHSFALF